MIHVRRAVTAIALGVLLAGSAAASAQIVAPQTLDRYFRVEWQLARNRTGPTIEGYVYNQAVQAAERMQLQIDRLDTSGGGVGHSTLWLLGDIPKNGRAYFRAAVPEGRATACRCSRSTGTLAMAAGCSAGCAADSDSALSAHSTGSTATRLRI